MVPWNLNAGCKNVLICFFLKAVFLEINFQIEMKKTLKIFSKAILTVEML